MQHAIAMRKFHGLGQRAKKLAAARGAAGERFARSQAASESPATCSLAIQICKAASPTSYTVAMCGWRSRAAVFASRKNRSRSGAEMIASGRCTFSAISRPNRSSSAK